MLPRLKFKDWSVCCLTLDREWNVNMWIQMLEISPGKGKFGVYSSFSG